jgi:hypothetical protein
MAVHLVRRTAVAESVVRVSARLAAGSPAWCPVTGRDCPSALEVVAEHWDEPRVLVARRRRDAQPKVALVVLELVVAPAPGAALRAAVLCLALPPARRALLCQAGSVSRPEALQVLPVQVSPPEVRRPEHVLGWLRV